MAYGTKRKVLDMVFSAVKKSTCICGDLSEADILPYIRLETKGGAEFIYTCDVHRLLNRSQDSKVSRQDVEQKAREMYQCIQPTECAQPSLSDENRSIAISFKVSSDVFAADVIKPTIEHPLGFWKSSPLLKTLPFQKVVTDFSSPNIAKPFHVGHLRSTVIGNFICNLHEAFDHHVTRINYLGDWGTQLGLLKYGFDKKGLMQVDLEENPLRKLYEIYVWANQEAKKDEQVAASSRKIFNQMEKGDAALLKSWQFFRDLSITELEKVYRRLNVSFSAYHGESFYQLKKCLSVLKLMEEKGLLVTLEDGCQVCDVGFKDPLPIVKADGSLLYLTRDIAAAVDRWEQFQFDRSYYVVDSSQANHFRAVFAVLEKLGYSWSGRLRHISFGRIEGMSTRKGTAILLEDVLNEASDIMTDNQIKSKNTRTKENDSAEIADIVGASAIIIADLKQRRQKNYVFNWTQATQNTGDTGVRLQYVHCRLKSLESNCGIPVSADSDLSCLREVEALNLVRQIARFDEVLYETYEDLQPHILVGYLLRLSALINSAFVKLPVKWAPTTQDTEARLLLFVASRHVLSSGMKILGLRPLDYM